MFFCNTFPHYFLSTNMNVIRFNRAGFTEALAELDRRAEPPDHVRERVREILSLVQHSGDQALLTLTRELDGAELTADQLKVRGEDIDAAWAVLDRGQKDVFERALKNVRSFAKGSLRKDWEQRNAEGVLVGERFTPVQRVGIYVPGGTAPLVSTVFMTVGLASAAGVPEIVVTTPPQNDGAINPSLLGALHLAGATEIYRCGGAQAIAALAFGTKTIHPVTKIFGPGNAYVAEAKRQVFGQVSIDLIAGPSEIMVLADDSAEPKFVAADLLAQAEHGPDSLFLLATPSESLLETVRAEILVQSQKLSRQEALQRVLEQNATLALVESLEAGIDLINRWAPEHLVLACKGTKDLIPKIHHAGAIFAGRWSPVAGGDFIAGPSHVLPTGGAAKCFGGLSADMFQNRTSIIRFGKKSLKRSLQPIETFSRLEGLDAHGVSASIRVSEMDKES